MLRLRNPAALSVLLVGALSLPGGMLARKAAAQEPGSEIKLSKDDEFWFSAQRRRAASAAQLVIERNPIAFAALRTKSKHELIWDESEFAADFAPLLNAEWLADMVDNRPLPDLRAKLKDELHKSAFPTYSVYCEALVNAFQTPAAAFKKSARENSDLKFPQIWSEAQLHRGKVIPVEGRLVRIRKNESPWPAKNAGVKFQYEGWLFSDTKRSHPYCLIFTTLPEGFTVTEEMNRKVSFNGYYLGRFRFNTPKGDNDMPLFIGPTIYPMKASPVAAPDEMSGLVQLGIVVGIIGGLAVLVGFIKWNFRKGDQAIRAKTAAWQEKRMLEIMERSEEWNQGDETKLDGQQGVASGEPQNRLPK